MPELKAYRGRIGLLIQELERRLAEVPNLQSAERLGELSLTFNFDERGGVDPATEQSYYRWRGRVTDEADEATRRVRELASEVERLKQCLAEVMLDNQMLREVAKKKW